MGPTEPGPAHRASATQVAEPELLWPRLKVSRRTLANGVSLHGSHHCKSKLTAFFGKPPHCSSSCGPPGPPAKSATVVDCVSGFEADVPLGVDRCCTRVSLPSRPTSWRQALAAESAQGPQRRRGRNPLTAGLHGAPEQPRIRRRRQREEGLPPRRRGGARNASMRRPGGAKFPRC